MNAFLLVFFVVCLLTTGWSVALVRRAPDWRIGFLTIVIGIMPLYQCVRVLADRGFWSVSTINQMGGLVELVISVLWFAAILILTIDSAERKCAVVRNRLLEALENVPNEQKHALALDANLADELLGPETNHLILLQPNESTRLLKVLERHRWEALFRMALALGLPLDQLLDLKWTEVDLLGATLSAPATLDPLNADTGRSHVSRRLIPLPPMCLRMLQQHLGEQQGLIRLAGDRWQDTGLVFTSNVGAPLAVRSVVREFRNLLRKAGLSYGQARLIPPLKLDEDSLDSPEFQMLPQLLALPGVKPIPAETPIQHPNCT